ncbi:hypothetical protein HKK72_35130 [Actinomadura sp. HBU206391]|nr:hypothetical protein [Actinomadura sp. HBU206391]
MAWETGLSTRAPRRALLLHALASPAAMVEDLLDVPVGARDADLFGLRGSLFGERMPVRATCPHCGEEIEFDFAVDQVPQRATRGPEALRVESGEWTVRSRVPTVGDLLAAADAGSGEEARRIMLSRCVVSASRGGTPVAAEDLPPHVQEQIAEAAAAADPCADIRLKLTCPECGRQATAELDIASYLWAEVDAWARGTLLDVHLLAVAYGWTEPEILALSPTRRRHYLELSGHA